MTIGCETSPCGRRQRGGDGVEACYCLDKDETGVVERVRIVNSGFGDRRDGNWGCFLYWGPEGSL